MSVHLDGTTLYLTGNCVAGEAETLLAALQDQPGAVIDVTGLEKIHMAVLQILLALPARLVGPPASPFLAELIFSKMNWCSDSSSDSR